MTRLDWRSYGHANSAFKKLNTETQDRYWAKNLGQLIERGYSASSIIVVDDTVESWEGHFENVVQVSKFKGDPQDCELEALLPHMEKLSHAQDVRIAIR